MYIELHSRSAFSFLEGASLPEYLVAACASLNMPAMALLDRDGVYGSPRFHMAAKKAKIKAHIGAEVTCETFSPQRQPSTSLRAGSKTEQVANHKSGSSVSLCLCGKFRLPLLVSSRLGYQNLCHLITKMKLRSAKGEGVVREEELREHAAGLICLTRDQWHLLCHNSGARTLRRIHRHSSPSHAGYRGTSVGSQFRAPSEIAARDASALRRFA